MKKITTVLISMFALWGCSDVGDWDMGELSDSSSDIPDGYIAIYTANHLASIGVSDDYPLDGNYIVMNDIDLSSYDNWTPIGSESNEYSGAFDGGGHTISNLTINSSGGFQGLFGWIKGGSISNLIIENSQVQGGDNTGAICGLAAGGTISTCGVAGGSVSGSGDCVGGIVGYSSSSLIACYNTGSVSGSSNLVGGIVGYSSSSLTDCYNTGSVSGSSSVGGVVGYADSSLTACYNTGEVSGSLGVGGVVGRAFSSLAACYNTGEVSGSGFYVGGVVGNAYSSSYLIACHNTGEVSGSDDYVGGVVGSVADSSITACYNTGEVSGSSFYVGGVVGRASSSSLTACYNTGEVSGSSFYVGCVVGSVDDSSITSCYYLPYSDLTYTNTDGTADGNLVATMTSTDFPETLNDAAGDDYFEFDTYNYNNGYPILISIDYSTIEE